MAPGEADEVVNNGFAIAFGDFWDPLLLPDPPAPPLPPDALEPPPLVEPADPLLPFDPADPDWSCPLALDAVVVVGELDDAF